MSVFNDKKSIFFVGGRGTKAGSANAGGCTQEFVDANGGADDFDLDLIMGSNGEALHEDSTSTAYYEELTGKIYMIPPANPSIVKVGMVAYVEYFNGPMFITDRYEITDVDTSNFSITIESGQGLDGALVNVYIGGAFDSIATAAANVSGTSHSVKVYTNKDEVLGSSLATVGKGFAASNKFADYIGFNTKPNDMSAGQSYYQSPVDALQNGIDATKSINLDGSGGAFSLIAPTSLENVGFHNFHFTNSTGNGIDVTSGTPQNVYVVNCKFSNLSTGFMASAGSGMSAVGCYSHSDLSSTAIYFAYGLYGSITDCVFNLPILVANNGIMAPDSGIVARNLFLNGKKQAVTVMRPGLLEVFNNTFYNQPAESISISNADAVVKLYNNIFMIPQTSRAVNTTTSGGSVMYNDYNCYWGIDGSQLSILFATDMAGGELPVIAKNSIEVDPLFINVSDGYFWPKNMGVLRGGKPFFGGPVSMGAYQKRYQFTNKVRAGNPGRIGMYRN